MLIVIDLILPANRCTTLPAGVAFYSVFCTQRSSSMSTPTFQSWQWYPLMRCREASMLKRPSHQKFKSLSFINLPPLLCFRQSSPPPLPQLTAQKPAHPPLVSSPTNPHHLPDPTPIPLWLWI